METMDLSLLDLPDDALLAVLAYLSPAELLGCRVVCRRLRDLCLHSDLWKSTAIDTMKLLPALRVAPCLRKISLVNLEQKLTPAQREKVTSLLASTECVVAELEVIAFFDDDDVPLATAMVKKFSALGGLRALELIYVGSNVPDSYLAPLLKAAFGVGGLRELRIIIESENPPNPASWSITAKQPSLTKLVYTGILDPFLELLLTTHAPTLEDVSLSLRETDHLPMNLLRMMPRLRSFACKASALLDTAGLSNLNTLKFIDEDLPDFPPSALNFLCQAPHLRSVSFASPKENHAAPLQALASSPSARLLESLTVCWARLHPDSIGVEMAANILPHFPSLQSLSLEWWLRGDALDGFLQAVTPTSAPSLTSLSMKPLPSECAHGWLHSRAVQELLERNPRLHLHVLGGNRAECSSKWCRRLGCHEELLKLDDLQHLVLSAHRRMAGCPNGCQGGRSDLVSWQRFACHPGNVLCN
ncbi:uncharacterized protein LOC117647173 [Thrips palmi]|uniref:Uncharacterized protein LOC117647173 n=1 Tax=Thrips palmi TaxID=161013 RepID=A0A6P8ZPT6_THRPL|nr:uncharacterized protein LOC117647173 [Thrips palmi]XP_034244669.1 uncharacterized protein LOC117647173 [Thrips palmi]XP_034244670.1 uncharacterized protein LOC117647173 [Thrips palmi]XP_034244671.1 uncharacterized protein LOC117647173 [Thrips palmi]XP_034244672.1 uncharacterized protein LOC117647173 [Thrips palmi]XP_034244673.1 uncharacterized protein LOC117647173 [Thrips palmi]